MKITFTCECGNSDTIEEIKLLKDVVSIEHIKLNGKFEHKQVYEDEAFITCNKCSKKIEVTI